MEDAEAPDVLWEREKERGNKKWKMCFVTGPSIRRRGRNGKFGD
jgi:hypothetical protein